MCCGSPSPSAPAATVWPHHTEGTAGGKAWCPAIPRRPDTDWHTLLQVYHLPYYEACVRDACGCDSGGDCECLCDAVAAYAQACLDKGVCVDWRTPDFCRE